MERDYLAMVLGAVLGLALTGCGEPYKIAPVSGKVTLDGQPLANVNVSFQPNATAGPEPGPGSIGTTDAQGQYTLKTIGEVAKPGAVVGSHTVRFSPAAAKPAPGQEALAPSTLPPAVSATALEFTVPPEGTNQAGFDLKSTGSPATPAGGPPSGPPAAPGGRS